MKIGISGFSSWSASEVGVTRGLVAWYPLMGDTKDYAGVNHAVNNGAVATAEGYEFDGVDDYLVTEGTVSFSDKPWSVLSLYTPLSSSGYGHIFTSSNSQGDFACKISKDLEPYFYAGSSFRTVGTGMTPLVLNTLHLVAYVFDGQTVKIYVDGELRQSTDVTPNTIPDRQFLIQGGNSEFTAAVHADLRIHNVALTPEEVAIQAKLALNQQTKTAVTSNCLYTQGQFKEVVC